MEAIIVIILIMADQWTKGLSERLIGYVRKSIVGIGASFGIIVRRIICAFVVASKSKRPARENRAHTFGGRKCRQPDRPLTYWRRDGLFILYFRNLRVSDIQCGRFPHYDRGVSFNLLFVKRQAFFKRAVRGA